MAEPDLSFPLAPVDRPEFSLEQGPGDLADQQFLLVNVIQINDEMTLQLMGPQDESQLPSNIGKDIYSYQKMEDFSSLMEDKSHSVFAADESEAKKRHLYHEMADYNIVMLSLSDLFPVQYGSGGQSKCLKKSTSRWAGLHKPSAACRGTISGGRKKIKRWTSQEAKKLVKGVSEFGVGNWTDVKRAYFGSFRETVHLKDKWRDLVRACGIQVGSKKEVKAQGATLKIIKGLEEKIRSIYRKNVTLNRRAD